LIYLVYSFKETKRIPILLELFFLSIYGFIFLIFVFPQTLDIIERVLGVQSAINFILYLSVFVAYLLVFVLYRKHEDQREEITKLVREIAFLKDDNKKRK